MIQTKEILTILILALISGCLNHDSFVEKDKLFSNNFKIIITNSNDEDYNVYIPIPLVNNTSSLLGNKDLLITHGTGKFNIQDSEKGLVLNISGNSSLTIELTDLGKEKLINNINRSIYLSTLIDEDKDNFYLDEIGRVQYWLYLYSQHFNKINIYYYFDYSNNYYYYETEINQSMSYGWNKSFGTVNIITSD